MEPLEAAAHALRGLAVHRRERAGADRGSIARGKGLGRGRGRRAERGPRRDERRERAREAGVRDQLEQRLLDASDVEPRARAAAASDATRTPSPTAPAAASTRSERTSASNAGGPATAGSGSGSIHETVAARGPVPRRWSRSGPWYGADRRITGVDVPHDLDLLDLGAGPRHHAERRRRHVEDERAPRVERGGVGGAALGPVHDEAQVPDRRGPPDLLLPLAREGLPQALPRLDGPPGKVPEALREPLGRTRVPDEEHASRRATEPQGDVSMPTRIGEEHAGRVSDPIDASTGAPARARRRPSCPTGGERGPVARDRAGTGPTGRKATLNPPPRCGR